MTEHQETPHLSCGCNLTGAFASITFCPMHDAAPDLLAALEEAEREMMIAHNHVSPSMQLGIYEALKATIGKARAAIAKAHGKKE